MIEDLTHDERLFLKRHKILVDQVLDARGLPTHQWQGLAREEEKLFVLGETCRDGHRLRDRSNHCLVCSPANIAFQRRNSQKGTVYIAASKAGKIYKVGSTQDATLRESKLNSDQYGGFTDWRIIAWAKVAAMGKTEFEIHKKLEKFEYLGSYIKNGRPCATRELFQTSLVKVWQAFLESTRTVAHDKRWKHRGFSLFEFEAKR